MLIDWRRPQRARGIGGMSLVHGASVAIDGVGENHTAAVQASESLLTSRRDDGLNVCEATETGKLSDGNLFLRTRKIVPSIAELSWGCGTVLVQVSCLKCAQLWYTKHASVR
jgi:hypothetical protein